MPANKAAHTVASVCAELERIAPSRLAKDWDNVGLLAGDLRARVKRVLLCIDLMPDVVREAIRQRTDLVVAYHPPIFRPISRLVWPGPDMEANVMRCVAKGIAVYAPHTALDGAPGGTNDVLAKLCGAVELVPLEPEEDNPAVGMGRVGTLRDAITLTKLARRLKRRAKADCVSIVGNAEASIRRAIVVVGAAGSLPFGFALGPRDAIVTGEIRHHDALTILRRGTNAIALSHWSSEHPALDALANRLTSALPGARIQVSKTDREPFQRI